MKELDIFTPNDLGENRRAQLMLLVCDESSISCITFRKLQEVVAASGLGAVLVMPDYQYQKGLRGWAKARILASIIDKLEGIMPLDNETLSQELGNNWAVVQINGPITWGRPETMNPPEIEVTNLKIVETNDPFDRAMIDRAKRAVVSSNCWLDPAGCVFARDGEVLLESCSTSLNHSGCITIPINFRELQLNSGERMMFCDSLHSERVGISEAAKKGISLKASTMYITKFPCRSCSLSAIATGVTSIVFDQRSYGLIEAADLFETNEVTLKRVVS